MIKCWDKPSLKNNFRSSLQTKHYQKHKETASGKILSFFDYTIAISDEKFARILLN